MLSLQLTTSKPDVYLKFTIYDNGENVFSVYGKGTAIIPAFTFLKDKNDPGNEQNPTTSRPGSKTCKIEQARGRELRLINCAKYLIILDLKFQVGEHQKA